MLRKINEYLYVVLIWVFGLALAGFGIWTVYYAFAVCGWWALWLGKASFWAAIFGMCS